MSVVVNIAEAVKDLLNAAPSLSQNFTATRVYVPQTPLEELGDLTVKVAPRGLPDVGQATRSAAQWGVAIDIGIQKRLASAAGSAAEKTEIDGLIGLVEEISDYLRQRPILDNTVAWLKCEVPALFVPDHLVEQRVFTAVITVTYRTIL